MKLSSVANIFRKLKPIEINIILPESEQPKKLSRIEKVMKLCNQCIADNQWDKVAQANLIIQELRQKSINRTKHEIDLQYIKQQIKYNHLNLIR